MVRIPADSVSPPLEGHLQIGCQADVTRCNTRFAKAGHRGPAHSGLGGAGLGGVAPPVTLRPGRAVRSAAIPRAVTCVLRTSSRLSAFRPASPDSHGPFRG